MYISAAHSNRSITNVNTINWSHILKATKANLKGWILSTSNRILTMEEYQKRQSCLLPVDSCHGTTIVMSDCTIVKSGHHGSIRTKYVSNSSITQKTCNSKYIWLPFLILPPSGYSIWCAENYLSFASSYWICNERNMFIYTHYRWRIAKIVNYDFMGHLKGVIEILKTIVWFIIIIYKKWHYFLACDE